MTCVRVSVEVEVEEGDVVDNGQVLFRLNNEEYRQAVRSAKVQF